MSTGQKTPDDRRQAAIRAYYDGMTMKQAAELHGVSQSSVHRWLNDANPGRPYAWAPVTYSGGWITRGGIKVPLRPMPRTDRT